MTSDSESETILVTNDKNLINKSLINKINSLDYNDFLLRVNRITSNPAPKKSQKRKEVFLDSPGPSHLLTKKPSIKRNEAQRNSQPSPLNNMTCVKNVKKFMVTLMTFLEQQTNMYIEELVGHLNLYPK